jgi:hypothetical protein
MPVQRYKQELADVMLVRGTRSTFGRTMDRSSLPRSCEVAGESGHEDVVHRAWESVGERIRRKLQRQAEG